MDAVGRWLFSLPQRGLRLVPVPGVFLPCHMGVENGFVLELITAKAPGERVLGPDQLAANFEPRGIDGVLKLPLPLRAVADVQRGARFDDPSVACKDRR